MLKRSIYVCLLFLMAFTPFLMSPVSTVEAGPYSQDCSSFTSRLNVNSPARWTLDSPANLRNSPGRDGALVSSLPANTVVNIVDGPVCVDDFVWWLVNYEGSQGWLPEGQGSAYWLAPITEQALETRDVADVLTRLTQTIPQSSTWSGFPPLINQRSCEGLTGTQAYVENRRLSPVQSGATVELSREATRDTLPVICTDQPVSNATAIGPDGSTLNAVVYQNGNMTAVTLPLNALAVPGRWTLRTNTFEIFVSVRQMTEPQVITQPAYLSQFQEEGILIGGFEPFENVVLTTVPYEVEDNEVGAYQVQTDANGYWVGLLSDQCLQCITVVTGNSGQSVAVRGMSLAGQPLSAEQVASLVHAAIWRVGQPSGEQCENLPASRLSVGTLATTAVNTTNVLRTGTTSTSSTISYIAPEQPFQLLFGPLCDNGTAWWLVDYNGEIGWTAELDQTTYLLETYVPSTACANEWFFTLQIPEDHCPQPVQFSQAAGQDFEGGRAYWYENPPVQGSGQGVIFIIYNDGTWEYFVDTYNPNTHPEQDPNIQAPENRFQPKRGIGLIWRSNAQVRERLGWAYEEEYLFDGRYQFPEASDTNYVYIDHGAREVVLKLDLTNYIWTVAGNY